MFTFTVEEAVTIDRPIEEVFAFVADSENDPRWCPSVKEIEPLGGNGSRPGTRYRMHHAPGGMKFEAIVEIVECSPPHTLKWVMTDSGHTLHGAYELEAMNGKTRLIQTSRITLEGWLRIPGLFMKRFIARDVQNELGKQFAALKEVLETEEVA